MNITYRGKKMDGEKHTMLTLIKESSTYINFRQTRLQSEKNFQGLRKGLLHNNKGVNSLRRHNL